MNQCEYALIGTKGIVIRWKGHDYTLGENIVCKESYSGVTARAETTTCDEVLWSFETLQEAFDWADAGDFQKNMDGVIVFDED